MKEINRIFDEDEVCFRIEELTDIVFPDQNFTKSRGVFDVIKQQTKVQQENNVSEESKTKNVDLQDDWGKFTIDEKISQKIQKGKNETQNNK